MKIRDVFLPCMVYAWVVFQSGNILEAQSLRVITKLTDVSIPESPQPLSHTLTLFHGGRVYDYMEEVGEVVIFEPIHNRFLILGKNYAATEVSFAEINHFLESAHKEAVQYIEELSADTNPASARQAASVRFQLSPDFQESFDAANHQLTLSGTELKYTVIGQPVEESSLVDRYLEYADWAKRLNFVLHQHSSLPQSRLTLNKKLRDRQMLPVTVELVLHLDPPVKLRAEHRYEEVFQANDRRHISHWERMLKSEKIRWMTFREYQQNLLVDANR